MHRNIGQVKSSNGCNHLLITLTGHNIIDDYLAILLNRTAHNLRAESIYRHRHIRCHSASNTNAQVDSTPLLLQRHIVSTRARRVAAYIYNRCTLLHNLGYAAFKCLCINHSRGRIEGVGRNIYYSHHLQCM